MHTPPVGTKRPQEVLPRGDGAIVLVYHPMCTVQPFVSGNIDASLTT